MTTQLSREDNIEGLGSNKLVRVQHNELFTGPLPHPDLFEKYERILPGLADRITKMAEKQSAHRQKIESRVINFDMLKSLLGLIFALIIVIVAIVAGVYLIVKGNSIAGGVVSLFPLTTIVGMFIYQNYWKDMRVIDGKKQKDKSKKES